MKKLLFLFVVCCATFGFAQNEFPTEIIVKTEMEVLSIKDKFGTLEGPKEVQSGATSSYVFRADSLASTPTTYVIEVTNGKVSEKEFILNNINFNSFFVEWVKVPEGQTEITGSIFVKNKKTGIGINLSVKIKKDALGGGNDDKSNLIIPSRAAGYYYVGDSITFKIDDEKDIIDSYDGTTWEYDQNIFTKVSTGNQRHIKLVIKSLPSSNQQVTVRAIVRSHTTYLFFIKDKHKKTRDFIIYAATPPKLVAENTITACYDGSVNNYRLEEPGGPYPILDTNWNLGSSWANGWIKAGKLSITLADGVKFHFYPSRFWLGPPIAKQEGSTLNIDDRNGVIIYLGSFAEGAYDYRWEYVSGSREYEIINSFPGQVLVKTNLSVEQTGQTVLKCIASNACGSVSTYHTINVEEAKGTSFQNPRYIGEVNQRSTLDRRDDLSYFSDKTIYYSFLTTEDQSLIDFSFMRQMQSPDSSVTYHLYDDNLNLIKSMEVYEEQSSTSVPLSRGSYYLVCEGADNDTSVTTKVAYYTQGTSFETATPVEIDFDGFCFSDARDLGLGIYTNAISDYSDGREIFYKLSLPDTAQMRYDVRVHIVGSKGSDKYLHLAEYNSESKVYNIIDTRQCRIVTDNINIIRDDYYNEGSVLRFSMRAGDEYYIIAEGYKSSNAAQVNSFTCVTIEGNPFESLPLEVSRNSAPEQSIVLPLSIGNKYSFVENTNREGFYNLYSYMTRGYWDIWHIPSNAKEVYHTVTLTESADLIVHHEGSELQNTCIHVIPMNNIYDQSAFYSVAQTAQPLISNIGGAYDHDNPDIPSALAWGQAYAELKNLAPGTYCIISEGQTYKDDKRQNGMITVNIEAQRPSQRLKTLSVPIVEEKQTSVSLSPNPAGSVVDIIIDTEADIVQGTYQIIKISGGVMQKGQLYRKRTSIDISKLISGVYTVHMVINGKNVSSKLIVR